MTAYVYWSCTFVVIFLITTISFLTQYNCLKKLPCYRTQLSSIGNAVRIGSDQIFGIRPLSSANNDLTLSVFDSNNITACEHAAGSAYATCLVKSLTIPPRGGPRYLTRANRPTPQAETVMEILGNKRDGVFVEAGAFDGETSSNTLYLEAHLGWSGVLVEMEQHYYQQLVWKNRNAYSINVCLSTTNSTEQITFTSRGQLSSLVAGKHEKPGPQHKMTAMCIPLHTILKTLNVKKVDYLSLDLEGQELPVLKRIPWSSLDISIISVEYLHSVSSPSAILTYMARRGYKLYKDIKFNDDSRSVFVHDFVFVKQSLILKN